MLQNLPDTWRTCHLLTLLTSLRLLSLCDFVVVMKCTIGFINCTDAHGASTVWAALHLLSLPEHELRLRCVAAKRQGFDSCFEINWRKRSQVNPWVSPTTRPSEHLLLADAQMQRRSDYLLSRRFQPCPAGLVHPGTFSDDAAFSSTVELPPGQVLGPLLSL